MKGQWIAYTAEERAWLKANCTLPITQYHAAFCEQFSRADASAGNLHALRKREGWATGRSGRFEKGQVSHNKGQKCAPGTGGLHPNAQATHFSKGERRGVAVKLYKPVGTERLSKDGYRERKIHDGLPLQSRWRAIHLIEWEAINGPVPAGHCLKCLDGNRSNTAPDNWECIPREVLARLSGGRHRKTLAYDEAEPEIKPLVMAAAKLRHQTQIARSGGRQ